MVYYLSICTSTSVVLDLEYTSESQGGFVKRLLGPLPDFLIHETWGGAHEFAFLTSSWVVFMLLVLAPQLESHCSSSCLLAAA